MSEKLAFENATEEIDSSNSRSLQDITNDIYYIYMLLCIIIGLTGNSMVWILIRSNRILRKLPSNIYLLTLAVMSSLFLLSLFVFLLEEMGYIQPTTITCKLVNYVAHFCDFSSVWLIVLVCFERLILLYRSSHALNTRKAKIHYIVLLIVSLVFNSWILIVAKAVEKISDVITTDGVNKVVVYFACDIERQYEDVYTIMNIMDTIFCMALPSAVILISNLFVVWRLQTHLKNTPSSPTVSFNTADLIINSVPPTQVRLVNNNTRSGFGRVSSRLSETADFKKTLKRKKLRYADLQLTRSLLIVTWAFVALNLPNYIYRICINVIETDGGSAGIMQQVHLLVHALLYTHHAVLFYLYIFYSPQMKKRLVPTALKLLECYCLKPSPDISDHT